MGPFQTKPYMLNNEEGQFLQLQDLSMLARWLVSGT
jgi:hypothetical protein